MKITVHLRVLQNTRHARSCQFTHTHIQLKCQPQNHCVPGSWVVGVIDMRCKCGEYVCTCIYVCICLCIYIHIYICEVFAWFLWRSYLLKSFPFYYFFLLRVYLTDPAACTYLYIHSKIYVYVYKSGVKTTINLWSVCKKNYKLPKSLAHIILQLPGGQLKPVPFRKSEMRTQNARKFKKSHCNNAIKVNCTCWVKCGGNSNKNHH